MPVSAAPPPAIVVDHAIVRPVAKGLMTTAGYMTLRNTGAVEDTLVAAHCACARTVEPHETMAMPMPGQPLPKDAVGSAIMHMGSSGPVTIPAHGAVTFAPGGRHLMLVGMTRPLAAGETVRMVLTFKHAGAVPAAFIAGEP